MRGSNFSPLLAAWPILAALASSTAFAQDRNGTGDTGEHMRLESLPQLAASKTDANRPHLLEVSFATFGQTLKTRAASAEIGDAQLTLSATRSKKVRSQGLVDVPSSSRPMLSAAGELSFDLGASDSLALFGQWSRVKYRPIALLPGRKFLASQEQAAGLRWTNGGRFETTLAAYRVGPSGRRSGLERMVELAGGSPRRASGFSLTLVGHPDVRHDRLSYGVDLRQQRTDFANGFAPAARANEAIGSVFFRMEF